MKTIRVKMLLSLITVSIVIFMSIISFTSFKVRQDSVEQATHLIEAETDKYVGLVDDTFNESMVLARSIASQLKNIRNSEKPNRDTADKYLEAVMTDYPDLLGAWVTFEPNAFDGKDAEFVNVESDQTGRYIPYFNRVTGELNQDISVGYENTDVSGDWYQTPLKTGKEYCTDPYLVEVKGKQVTMVSLAVPIYHNSKFIGVAGVDIGIDKILELNKSIKMLRTGYGAIIGNNGNIIVHPNADAISKNFSEFINDQTVLDKIKKGERTLVTEISKLDNTKKILSFSPIVIGDSPTPWSLMISVPYKEVTESVDRVIMLILLISVVGILILVSLIFAISNSLSKPINELSHVISEFGDYNFTTDGKVFSKYSTRTDEMGVMARSLDGMHNNLKLLITRINDVSQQVAASSEELTATSGQSALAADEVARTIEEIARGASDQAQDTQQGVVKINEIGELIQDEQISIQNLITAAIEVKALKEEGFEILSQLVEKTKESNKVTKEINSVIKNTNEGAEKIKNASQMIQSIAAQTNLLALNASIEAARAGEAGKGFSVVAEEIKKLATQSSQFTKEIEQVIHELIMKTENAVKTVDNLRAHINDQSTSVESTRNTFYGISAAILKTENIINTISELGKIMNNKKNEVVEIIHSLSAIAEENAAGTEESSAGIEEQTAGISDIASASESLSRLAEELQAEVTKFKL